MNGKFLVPGDKNRAEKLSDGNFAAKMRNRPKCRLTQQTRFFLSSPYQGDQMSLKKVAQNVAQPMFCQN
jgi:hypothetical protein